MDNTSYAAYIQKHQRWNFVVNVLDLSFYNMALSFIYGSTVLSLYAGRLTSSATLIGLIPAVQHASSFLPQLFMARKAEQLQRMKPFVQKISVMERVPYLFVTLGIVLWPAAPNWFSYSVLLLSLGLATFSGGLAGPAWQGMLGKVIPPTRRGILFGLSHAVGSLLGLLGAAISRWALTNYAYPLSFGICFLFCFGFQVCSWISLSLNREPPRQPTKKAVSATDYWKRLPQVLRNNPNFARYLLSRGLIILGSMATPFYVLYARDTFRSAEGFAASLTMVALIGQALGNPLMGYLGDRWGHKRVTELSVLFGAGAVVLVLLAPTVQWLYGVFALLSLSTAGFSVANPCMPMEFGKQEDIPTFVALSATLMAGPILIAPVIAGRLVDVTSYRAMFGVALLLLLGGLASMHWGVREPRHQRTGE